MQSEAKKILEDAYDILETRGWCQGTLRKADGRVCLEGAVIAACPDSLHWLMQAQHPGFAAWRTLGEVIGRETGCAFMSPYLWNDAPERTVEDVKLVLKKAIES
ncbi:DUF6197 family protein [Streptomyces hydrogenans]|uniref:Uncharacterized protein n=1 Tax=Streptomyces hydrogenans TaxID=1873719 RepID=A0ABQ3PJJ5_9ACTN|nr:hypothetical protein [Streptomyces hydrogenans]GHG10131.1 hypothetical protein GCM10018784_23530 [Streptomyces hydrogenans]GHI25195.1 hypothetical protein Shyd_65660 [Streptomyces hydrogenans]